MWKLCTQDIWGYMDGEEQVPEPVWRTDVTDSELADMPTFLRRHLTGDIEQYAVAVEGEGFIAIRQKATGNPILQLYRLER